MEVSYTATAPVFTYTHNLRTSGASSVSGDIKLTSSVESLRDVSLSLTHVSRGAGYSTEIEGQAQGEKIEAKVIHFFQFLLD